MGNKATTKPNREEVDILDTVINMDDIIRVVRPLLDQYKAPPRTPDRKRPPAIRNLRRKLSYIMCWIVFVKGLT